MPQRSALARSRRVHLALAVVLTSWASAFVGIRAVAAHLAPGPMALGRLLVAVPILVAVTWRRRRAPAADGARRRPWRSAVLVGLYGTAWFAAYGVALAAAEHHLDAGTAAMLVNVAPLLVAVLAGVLLGEGFPARLVLGLLVASAGVALIGLGGRGHHVTTTGILLGLLAAVLYATGVLAQKVALRTVDPARATLWGVIVAVAVLLPWLPDLVRDLLRAPPGVTAWLVYLGAVPTALGFSLWAYVLRRIPAGRTASATLAVPAITVVLSWALLSEVPTTLALVGGAIALLGVALSRR